MEYFDQLVRQVRSNIVIPIILSSTGKDGTIVEDDDWFKAVLYLASVAFLN